MDTVQRSVVVFEYSLRYFLRDEKCTTIGYLAMALPTWDESQNGNSCLFSHISRGLSSRVLTPIEVTRATVQVNSIRFDIPFTKTWDGGVEPLIIGRSAASKVADSFQDHRFQRVEAYVFGMSGVLILVCPDASGDGGPYWTVPDNCHLCFKNSASVISKRFCFTVERPPILDKTSNIVVNVTLDVHTGELPENP